MSLPGRLYLLANARVPSQRAQTLQVVQMAGAFQRAGADVTLLHAQRYRTEELPGGTSVWDYYAASAAAGRSGNEHPTIEAVPCFDWIDRVPRPIQYLPARLQELSFARNAAKRCGAHADVAYCREAEAARALVRAGRRAVFLEMHRVPGGRTRRRWLVEAAAGARGVVAISEGVRADLVHVGVDADAIVVAHDGFEPARFANPPTQAEARSALGLPAEAQVVVYTGGLLAWKGVDVLVEAAHSLADVTFLIVGGMDRDVAQLRERAGDAKNIRIEGFQPPERVVDYLAAADIGVVPNRSTPTISARYTSPLKIFEAMAMGLPLVASNLASTREILQEKKFTIGVLTAPDSASSLAAALRSLLDDEKLRAAIRERSLELAPSYSWDARATRLLAWMEERLQ